MQIIDVLSQSGPVSGDRLQRSFLEFYYCQYEQEQQTGEASLSCPACHPDMVAVAVDGNRKLYRFKSRRYFSPALSIMHVEQQLNAHYDMS